MENEIKGVVRQTTAMIEAFAEGDSFMPAVAKMCASLYKALLKEGFTEDQAIQIVANFKTS